MSDLPSPRAPRLPSARWADPRLLLGLLLILASVALGAKLFAEADQRVAVWAVTRDLGADTVLSERDLVVRSVRLDATAARYASAQQRLDGHVLTRPIGRFELLPVAALRKAGATDLRRMVVEVDRFTAAGLDTGSVVDVYTVRTARADDQPQRPELVLTDVTVAAARKDGRGGFGGTGGRVGVTLLLPAREVPSVIDAVAHGTLYLVQVPASAGRSGS